MSMLSTKTIKVVYVCSDADKDKKLLKDLEKHLGNLKRNGDIDTWEKSMIAGGKDISNEIYSQLNKANIILPLISSDFIASDENWNIVAQSAMARHRSRKARARVIPILLRPVENSWKSAFPNIKALPENEKPITSWKPYDNAFKSIAEGIREAVKEINSFPFSGKLLVQQIASLLKRGDTTFSSSSTKSKRRSNQKNGSLIAVATVAAIVVLSYQASNYSKEIIFPKPTETFVSTENVSPIGWIWIGNINSHSNYLLNSSINPPIVPSRGALVTFDKSVTLWKSVKHSYNSTLPEKEGILKPYQKLIILQVKHLKKTKSKSSDKQIWVQVDRCNQPCDK